VTDATTPTDAGSGGSAPATDAAASAGAASTADSDVTLESPPAPSAGAGAGDGWSTGATEGDTASSAGTADVSADATTPVDPATAAEALDPADVAAPEVGASVTASTAADVTAGGEAPLDAAAAAPSTDTAPAAAAPSADPVAGAAAAPGGALSADRIQLVGESGQALTLGVRTPLGKHAVRQFGDDFNVWDTEQCVIERGADGAWQIVPGAATTNETLLNGERITAPAPLHDGDVVSVGRAEKGISKLPLTVRTA
jgi:hypothetical protein